MQRWSTALRHLRRVSAADVQVGQRNVALAADKLFNGRTRRRAASSDAPTSDAAHRVLVCACILERLPIVMPAPLAWETDYEEWQYEKNRATFKEYPRELIEPKAAEDDEAKQSWTAATPADLPSDLRSPLRKPEEFVYLLLRHQSGAWGFPQAAHKAGETVRQGAQRALEHSAPGLDTYFIGNAPAAHAAVGDGTTFFICASYLGGKVALPRGGATDYAWVSKQELGEYVGPELHALLANAL